MYLKTTGLDAVAKKMSVVPVGDVTPVKVVASQFADLYIPAALGRALTGKQYRLRLHDYAICISQREITVGHTCRRNGI
jgi:formylmethanofuran dehydrogenase subunit B